MPRDFPLDQDGFNPFASLIDLEFTAVDEGFSRCTLQIKEQLRNPHDVLSGGILYTMADFGMGAALYPTLDGDELPSTIHLTINYFRPVDTGSVTCETSLINRSRSLAYFESNLYNQEKVVARANGTFFIAKR